MDTHSLSFWECDTPPKEDLKFHQLRHHSQKQMTKARKIQSQRDENQNQRDAQPSTETSEPRRGKSPELLSLGEIKDGNLKDHSETDNTVKVKAEKSCESSFEKAIYGS